MNTNRFSYVLVFSYSAFLVGNCLGADARGAGAARPVPFVIEATENVDKNFPGAPRLHSFVWIEAVVRARKISG
jgi:hypothetical protein